MLSDTEFRMLLDRLDRPWSGYRKVRKGVKKRLRRHMQALGCSTVERYIDHIDRTPAEMAVCQKCLRVTISRFFRDRQLWRVLQEQVLPGLASLLPAPIRIWSAGCACGEEPYGLAMACRETVPAAAVDLLATDASPQCLDRARSGVYTRGSLKELPTRLRETYFASRKGGRQFQIQSHRLPPIRWHQHDLLDAPPEPDPFHLILLRNNLLTYYRGPVLEAAFARIAASLAPGGCLVTGSHERLPSGSASLVREKSSPWIYRFEG